jgi:hypothetical protein
LSRSSGAKALEDEGEGDAAQEGGAEQDLGPGLGFGVAEARVDGGRRERGVDLRDGLGLAGGGLGLGLRGIAVAAGQRQGERGALGGVLEARGLGLVADSGGSSP